MAGPTGHGGSLGAALDDLLRAQVTPRHRLSSYNAKHWHAQLSQLTGTHRGYQALEEAGLDVTAKTLLNWLSDPEYNVRRSYRDLIHTAYGNVAIVPADRIPDHVKDGQYEISGWVTTGTDRRERGTRDAAPLRIDGSRGDWAAIENLWLAGELTDDEFEDHVIDDVIVADIGEGTDGWEFDGGRVDPEDQLAWRQLAGQHPGGKCSCGGFLSGKAAHWAEGEAQFVECWGEGDRGRPRGRPGPSRGTRLRPRATWNCGESPRCPAVITSDIGF